MAYSSLLPDEAASIASDQCRSYTSAIGSGVERAMIEDVRNFAQSARTHERFVQYAEIRFVYEMLLMEGGFDKILALVNSWVENDANVDRAACHVQREPTVRGQALVRAFCIFRLKKLDGPQWEFLDNYGAQDPRLEEQGPQTVVFIALTQLCHQNGFFINLEAGQDVCIDSTAGLIFPPEGGGLGVFVCLNL
ncbi:hypothetical protein LTR95_016793 [Oleoguttula sp. CCFEE 5521]